MAANCWLAAPTLYKPVARGRLPVGDAGRGAAKRHPLAAVGHLPRYRVVADQEGLPLRGREVRPPLAELARRAARAAAASERGHCVLHALAVHLQAHRRRLRPSPTHPAVQAQSRRRNLPI